MIGQLLGEVEAGALRAGVAVMNEQRRPRSNAPDEVHEPLIVSTIFPTG